jgi:hypothetical protein
LNTTSTKLQTIKIMNENNFRSNSLLAKKRHDALVAAARNPTLADVANELFVLDGLRCTETDVAGFLLGAPLDAGRQRGLTGTSLKADAATQRAAELSKQAEASDDTDMHEQARQAHADARSLHRACAAYHDLQTTYHKSKANPTPAEASAATAPDGEAKTVICPGCNLAWQLEPDELAADFVKCPNCNSQVNVSSNLKESLDEDQKPVETGRLERPAALEICCARSLPSLLGAGELANVIAYMPGGVHQINPSQGGKPVTVTVLVNPKTADTLERQRAALESGGNKPFFSVQHNTQIAAFWPSRFFWDTRPDPSGKQVAGVYAEGEWSQAGREAVEGKNFRTFSPTFFVTKLSTDPEDPAEVEANFDAKLNMGALENDPAFRALPPLWVSQPQPRQ